MLRACIALLALAACGDDTMPATPDAGTADMAFPVAAHEPFPQVPDQGGPRLAHPALVTITFPGDARRADLEGYGNWILGSKWLATVGADYGVGAGTVATGYQWPSPPPATTDSGQIETALAAAIHDGMLGPPAGTLYVLYYPSTTSITATFVDGIKKTSCTDWAAYHGEGHVGGIDFSYAVIADCNDALPGLTDEQTVEYSASHELIEAATDAFPITHPAWQLRPDPKDAWYGFYQFEVEVGDLCELELSLWQEGDHYAQRIWSNAAAAAGLDPCVPSDGASTYFNTSATPSGVVHVAPGASTQYELRGWSLGPVPNWYLSTNVTGALQATTSFSTMTMNNGGTATLTVSVPADAVPGSSAQIALFSSRSQTKYHAWVLDVVTP